MPGFMKVFMEPNTIELQRIVVEFSSFVRSHPQQDLYPISDDTFLALVQDKDVATGQVTWHCLSEFSWWYSTVAQICQDRACQTETGELLPDGNRLKAEAYLKLWRQAHAQAISFSQMNERGFRLVATISKPTAFCQHMLANGTDKRDKAFASKLGSPYIVTANEQETVWRIPIIDVQSMHDYNAVNCWHNPKEYPGEFVHAFDIELAPAANTAAPAASPLTTHVAGDQFDLFLEAA
jgi:hypothetical protein